MQHLFQLRAAPKVKLHHSLLAKLIPENVVGFFREHRRGSENIPTWRVISVDVGQYLFDIGRYQRLLSFPLDHPSRPVHRVLRLDQLFLIIRRCQWSHPFEGTDIEATIAPPFAGRFNVLQISKIINKFENWVPEAMRVKVLEM